MKQQIMKFGLVPVCLLSSISAFAAVPVDLAHQDASILKSFASLNAKEMSLQEVSRAADFNQTLHVRIKQTYMGYPVLGGDAVLHVPNAGNNKASLTSLAMTNARLNGNLYQALTADLANTPAYVFNDVQAQKALQESIRLYQQKLGAKPAITEPQTQLMVYVGEDKKAHWVFRVSFNVAPIKANSMPAKPVYLIDALSFTVYDQWNDIKTIDDAFGGGFGGNKKMGKMTYDGLGDDLPKLNIKRDLSKKLCFLQNDDVTVRDFRNNKQVMTYACDATDNQHGNVYWNGDTDAVNGAFSPSNDALFEGAVIKNMYQNWYDVPVLTEDGKPMMLNMVVHENIENAYWDGKQMTFGDGGSTFYPLTSLGVAAHEISHGFTEQHSNLTYSKQSGGMNEAFSDMAAQAAEYYAYGKNNWMIGPEIFIADGALRYMDQPSKDCKGWPPGLFCSIDNAKQYSSWLDVHFSSGVYNRFFYLLGTSAGWDTRKAFNVMVQANMHYWTPESTFNSGACGVLSAAKDYNYDLTAVKKAFITVGIDTTKC